jgi:5S rRNA maturation endonuclease (ribonuclease M5)/energy-coupling factor transporter ATP-binding protein EcfA2
MKPDLSPADLCRRYLAAIPGLSEGEGRDREAFKVAAKIIERFALDDEDLVDALLEWNGNVNRPPLSERDVRKCFVSARRTTEYDPSKARSKVPPLDRANGSARPQLREVKPACPLPDEAEWQRMRQQLLGDKPAAVEARKYLESIGLDPETCGWGLSKLDVQQARERGFGQDTAEAVAGVRFLVPVRDPLTLDLADIRRVATGPFARDDIEAHHKALPWAAGHGSAKPYRWDDACRRVAEIIWCEGEKDCEVLRAHGFIAVSHTCGAGSGRRVAEAMPIALLSDRRFILLFDADKAGRDAARALADELLRCSAAEVRVASWPADSPEGWDVTDHFTIGNGTAPELQNLLDLAEPHQLDTTTMPDGAPHNPQSLADWGAWIDDRLSNVKARDARNTRQEIAEALVEWALAGDRLIWDPAAKGAYLLDRGRVVLVTPKAGMALRAAMMQLGVNPAEDTFKWLVHALEGAAYERGQHVAISRWVANRVTPDAAMVYAACGERELVRATATADGVTIERLPNGTDDIWFAEDAWFPAWLPTDGLDPLRLQALNCPVDEGGQVHYDQWTQRRLLRLWLVAAISGVRPLWMLALLGGKGSGKTTACKAVAKILDPTSDVTATPDDVRDFETSISTQAICPMDNVDAASENLPKWLPDRLATTVTGGQVRRRALYTNGDTYLARITACVALSSRTAAYTRPDLTERTMPIMTRELEDAERRPELEMWAEIRTSRDGVLSWLIGRSAQVLLLREQAPLGLPSRFVDAAQLLWADLKLDGIEDRTAACLRAMGRAQAVMVQGGNPLLDAIMEETQEGDILRGTPKQIIDELEHRGHDLPFYGGWKKVGSELRELRGILRNLGYRFAEAEQGNATVFTIEPPKEIDDDPFTI